jgi:Phage integrase family
LISEADGAEEVAVKAIEDLQRDTGDEDVEAVGMTGALWLVSAVAAVRNNDPWTARDRLRDKVLPAARVTGDMNVMWTVFGPTNVGLHAVSVEMEMGEAGEALRLADDIDISRSPSLERKTTFALEVARCYEQRRDDPGVFLHLVSGMRRCELAGASRNLLDLDAGTLDIGPTRVVVDGEVIVSDGKTRNAQHVLALDPFTLAVLRSHVEVLDQERKDLEPDYHDDGWLFCWENGKPPHPDTITRRFKRLAKAADLPEINLHDVRHSYATAGRNAKIDWKALSKRIGHADVAFTMKQYVQTDLEADREVANILADLIVGGLLATDEIGGQGDEDQGNEAENDEGPT